MKIPAVMKFNFCNIKYLFLILLVFLLNYKGISQITNGEFKIRYVSFKATVIISVPCTHFDSQFSSIVIKSWDAMNPEDLIFAETAVKKFRKIKAQNVDVRAKIIFFINGRKNEMCMNQFGVFTDGNHCYKNAKLFDFIKRKTGQ